MYARRSSVSKAGRVGLGDAASEREVGERNASEVVMFGRRDLMQRHSESFSMAASITFPQAEESSASLCESIHSQFYAPPSFDVEGSFQMNPLSAHPPRTPRSSTTASAATSSHSRPHSAHFGPMSVSIYDEKTDETETVHEHGGGKEGVPADDDEANEVELDEEDERVRTAEKRIGAHEVWRDIIATSYGRDKAFVSICPNRRYYSPLRL